MICDFDRIDALCAGKLPETERASVLTHMENCPACRAYYEAMAGLEGNETVPAGFADRVMDAVRATPQKKPQRRRMWQSVAAMAACAALVVGLGMNSGLFSADMAPTEKAPADGAPPRSVEEADAELVDNGDDFASYANGEQASDLPLHIHALTDEALCEQVRQWLAQQNIPQLYPTGPREAYDLTADQVKALNSLFPLLALPEEFLQLELQSAE